MKFRIQFAQQVVGAFVLFGMLSVAVVLILMGINQRWFASNTTFHSLFPTGEGLTKGMVIKLRGFEIGKVKDIVLNPANRVNVIFEIYDEYLEKVRPNSVLQLASSPIGLGGGLNFLPGKNTLPPLPPDTLIPSSETPYGRDLIARGLVDRPEGTDEISGILARVGPLLDNLNGILAQVDQGLAVRSSGDGLMAEIYDLVAGLNATLLSVEELISTATPRIDPILGDVNSMTGNFARLSEELADARGLIPKLLDPKGTIAQLLDDDNVLFNDLRGLLAGLDRTLSEVNAIVRYVNTQTPALTGILEGGRQTLRQTQDVLEGVSNNPLLRGGITPRREQGSTWASSREEDL